MSLSLKVFGGIIVFLGAVTAHAEDLNEVKLKKQLERHEGRKAIAYKDTEGNMTIGIGFNLERTDAKQRIEALGLDLAKVKNKQQSLSDQQIDSLFSDDVASAIADVKSLVPKYSDLSDVRKRVLIDMAFNLGRPKLAKFEKMLKAVNEDNFSKAADEMKDSTWYRQVGTRGKTLVEMMKSNADPDWLK